MRRIYDSQAIKRDDEQAFTPRERDDDHEPQAMRSVPSASLARLFLPASLHRRALSVGVETRKDTYAEGEDVTLRVTLKNRWPVPVTIRTRTPRLWTWTVDGAEEGSRVPEPLPDERRAFTFGRGERKRFVRRWPQLFKVSDREWEPASAGEYSIGAHIDVTDPEAKGLAAETTVRIE